MSSEIQTLSFKITDSLETVPNYNKSAAQNAQSSRALWSKQVNVVKCGQCGRCGQNKCNDKYSGRKILSISLPQNSYSKFFPVLGKNVCKNLQFIPEGQKLSNILKMVWYANFVVIY